MTVVNGTGATTQSDIDNVKNAPFTYKNAFTKPPLSDDFMYDFKYDFPLPTIGSADILDFSAEDEKHKNATAEQFLKDLERIIERHDSKAFAELFLDNEGVWRDKLVFSWDYRSFNTPGRIQRAASDLFPRTPVRNFELIDPMPSVERPYPDLSWLQVMFSFHTDLVSASGALNLVNTKSGYRIWSLHTVIEGLNGHPEVPAGDDHMTGDKSWYSQRAEDDNLEGVEPDVIVIGGGQCGLAIAARLKALDVTALVVERNQRIGDNWRNRYEYLSLHLPHWGDHFPYFPFPEHWPTYTPAGKMADWHEWYASALELTCWTNSNVISTEKNTNGGWYVTVQRGTGGGKYTRIFHPKHVVLAISLAGVPFVPDIPGINSFRGSVKHSTHRHSSREWVGKKALVVGTSSSGFDTAYDFARRGIDVTLLQRSPTYLMSLDESVPRMIAPVYNPEGKKRADIDTSDRVAYALPTGPAEELFRRTAKDIWDADAELISKMEKAGFKVWRGQRDTGPHTLANTRNGGFYFEASACGAIIDGKIKIEQGYPIRLTEDHVVLNGERAQRYDLVILATGFSSTVESVRQIFGDEIAGQCKPIWGIDEEGEFNGAWKLSGVDNLWFMVGSLQHSRYHSKKLSLRIKGILKGIAPKPYLD
ncbi:putative flavo protein [Aspergillus steynii IBT 23096]|uniref:Putative flavo protein n=1 Tax=Aspergillus steynii IBT 23096 TaxID=1392250 RepID=A0A2I2GF15_9EURO|nr:putative flavo protein [Aspergillus steynii IBT 23096]PLB51483.1 putative flavo protein [Aspergillus steynii IBT 23096]